LSSDEGSLATAKGVSTGSSPLLAIFASFVGLLDPSSRAVRVLASVGHAHPTSAVVFQLEVLVREFFSVNGLATSAISTGEISALNHEIFDDAMEFTSGVATELAASSWSFLTVAFGRLDEVLDGLWDSFAKESDDDSPCRFAADFNVKEDLVSHLRSLLGADDTRQSQKEEA